MKKSQNRFPVYLLTVCLCTMLLASASGVEVSAGTIDGKVVLTEDTSWNDTSAPYIINNLESPVTISADVTLTIGSGVQVENLHDNKSSFIVQGTLQAEDADFDFVTRVTGGLTPIVATGSGTVALTGCTLTINHSLDVVDPASAAIAALDSAQINVAGSFFNTGSAGQTPVYHAVKVAGSATLTLTQNAGVSTTFTGFSRAIYSDSGTGLSITGAAFTDCTEAIRYVYDGGADIPVQLSGLTVTGADHGVHVEAAAADVTISASTFNGCGTAIHVPTVDSLALVDVTIDNSAAIDSQVGVHTDIFSAFSSSGSNISHQNVGIRFALDKRGTDTSGITFNANNTDTLVEGEINIGTISADDELLPGRYILTDKIVVNEGVTLTLGPGVILAQKYSDRLLIECAGNIVANEAIFETKTDYYNRGGILLHGSATGTFTDCNFTSTSYGDFNGGYTYYLPAGAVTAIDDAVVMLNGPQFAGNTSGGYSPHFAAVARGAARMRLQASADRNSAVSGYRHGIYYSSSVDLTVNDSAFNDNTIGILCSTTANLFLNDSTFTSCPTGLQLNAIGVLVTNNVVLDNCMHGVSLPWELFVHPSVGLNGVTFTNGSYCSLPTGATVNNNQVMPAFPYLFNCDGTTPITLSATGALTFASGSTVKTRGNTKYDGYELFDVQGTLTAEGTQFDLLTSRYTNIRRHAGSRAIQIRGNGRGTFTDCTFVSADMFDSYDGPSSVLYLDDNAQVTMNGCSMTNDPVPGYGKPENAISVTGASTLTVRDYNDAPSSFTNFNFPVKAATFDRLPDVALDTIYNDCTYGCYLPGNQTLTSNTTVPATIYDLDPVSGPVMVAAGVTLTVSPGAEFNLIAGRVLADAFSIAGNMSARGAIFRFPTRRWSSAHGDGSRGFDFHGTAVGIFTDCLIIGQNEFYDADPGSKMIYLTDTAQVTLQGTNIEVEDGLAIRPYYGVYLSGDSHFSAIANLDVPTTIEGFKVGLFTDSFQSLYDVDTFILENDLDLHVRGNSLLTHNLTLPGNMSIELGSKSGIITIESGASLDFAAGTRLQHHWDYPALFLIKGSLSAVHSDFSLVTARYWLDSTGKYYGSQSFLFAGSGSGSFSNCQFNALDRYDNTYDSNRGARIFHLFDSSNLTLSGCGLQGTGTTYHRTARAIVAEGAASVTLQALGSKNSVFSSFAQAIRILSDSVTLNMRDTLLTRNVTGLYTDKVPATHQISDNTFLANTGSAVENLDSVTLDCSNNSLGHPSGPKHITNPFGLGDQILGKVNFQPYGTTLVIDAPELKDHAAGQTGNSFSGIGSRTNVLLTRFQVEYPEEADARALIFRFSDVVGLDNDNISALRLIHDVNGNGVFDTETDTVMATSANWSLNDRWARFDAEIDIPGSYLFMADFTGLEGGDALSVTLAAADLFLEAGKFAIGGVGKATHFINRLVVRDHPMGQVSNQLRAGVAQSNVELARCQLTEGYTLSGLDLVLSSVSGFSAADFSNVRLIVDSNNNGEVDFGERVIAAQTVSISGETGLLNFLMGTEPVLSGVSFIAFADLRNLHRGDKFTAIFQDSGVRSVDQNISVSGSTAAVTHQVLTPIMLLDAAFPTSNQFQTAAQLTALPLLNFTVVPSGRSISTITFPLWDVEGITAADLQNVRLILDGNRNGIIDTGETTTVGGTPTVSIDSDTSTGSISFPSSFIIPGADLLLVADVLNLQNDDTMTIGLDASEVTVPANDVIEGGVTPVRHSVLRAELPEAALQTNWTLTHRSPGGTSVTGSYSHDGSKLIVGYSSGTAYIFDASSNTPLLMLHKHFDKVKYAGFSADDTTAITVTYDGAVYLWDAVTGAPVKNLFSDLLVRYAIPSPDSTRLFIVTEGKAMLLDIDTGVTLWEFVIGDSNESQLYAADYAPDGSAVLVGAADKRAYLLNAETGQIIRYFQGHSQAVTGVTFAAGGQLIMTGSTDSTVTLWNITDNENPITTVTLNDEQALGAAVNGDGTRIAVLTNQSGTRRLRMYEVTPLAPNLQWAQVLPYTDFTGTYSSMTFSPGSDSLLICSNANTDRNLPAALAVQYSATSAGLIDFVGPRGRLRGWDPAQHYQRVRVSDDGSRIFYMHTEGLDLLPTEPGERIVPFPYLSNEDDFDITPDGFRLAYVADSVLSYYSVNDDRFTLIGANNIAANYGPLTLARNGGLLVHGDRLIRTLSGEIFANSPNPDTDYRSAFSPDESLWGIAFYNDMSIKTMLKNDDSGSLEYGVTLTNPYKARKILYHPDGLRVGCVDETYGVQFYRLSDNVPVGLYDYRSGYGTPRINDAALSHDGTMLAIARGNSVKLFDLRTGRAMRYFYPTHSGQADCLAIAVGFGTRDNMLYIGWSDSYVEIFNRSKLSGLRIAPGTRTLAAGESQDFTVKALYDDGSSVDVTPEYLYRAAGAQLAPGARLYAEPAAAVTIEADRVTVNAGASGDVAITAIYTEGGFTRTATAVLTIGNSSLLNLMVNPAAVTLTPGVVMPLEYEAAFSDGYQTEVTRDVVLSSTSERVRIVGNNISVLPGTLGDIEVTGTFSHKGVLRTAQTVISVHSAKSRWERTLVTPGGDINDMKYSPDGSLFATGGMSGAVTIYTVGLTPTQYEVQMLILAHSRPVHHLYFRSDTSLVTVGADGTVRQWDLANPATPQAEFQSDAVLTCAAFSGRYGVIGDNVGRLMLFDLDNNAPVWQIELHDGQINSVALDAADILSGGEDRRVHLLDRATGSINMSYSSFARPPVAVGFEGNLMYVLSRDKRLAKWEKGTEDGNLAEYFFPSQPSAMTVAGGRTYVATTNNGGNAVWVYDSNGLLIRWLDVLPAEGLTSSLAVPASGAYIVTGRSSTEVEVETEEGTETRPSEFHSCQFWDLNRGSYSGSLGHSYSLNDAAISQDGRLLFTQSARRVFRWTIGQTQTRGGSSFSGDKFLETGYFIPYDFANLEMSGDAAGLVGTRVRDSIYLMNASERLLHMSVHTDAATFGISPNGERLITNARTEVTRFWNINLDFPTVYHENPVTSHDVAFIDDIDSLGSMPDDMFISIFNAEGLRYSGILIEPVSEQPPEADSGMGEEMSGPLLENMVASSNGQRVALVLRYVKKDMLGGATSYIYVQVYDISDRLNSSRVFERFLGEAEGTPPVALTLSQDGALAFFGLGASGNEAFLYDINVGRELNRFRSPSAGTLSDLGPVAAQFTQNDAAIMIAWREGIAEIYHRQGVDGIRILPAQRSVAAGDTVEFNVEALYADDAWLDVSSKATLSAEPSTAAVIDGMSVSIAAGVSAGQTITVTASYTELGVTRTAQSILTVQNPFFMELSVDPPKISLARGQSARFRFFAHLADGRVSEVTDQTEVDLSPAGLASISGTTVTVLGNAQYGDVVVKARFTRDGDERTVDAFLHIRNPSSMINPGDFDESLTVDFNDLIYFIGHYGETSAAATWDSRCDFNENGSIDEFDAQYFVGLYGTNYSPARGVQQRLQPVDGAATVLLEAPEKVEVGDIFDLAVYVQENDPFANGFRGGPVTVQFDPEKVRFAGTFDPSTALETPFNSIEWFMTGALEHDRIADLGGLMILDDYGDGTPVHYATLRFEALESGDAGFSVQPSSVGTLVLTPPIGRLTLGDTDYSAARTVVIDLSAGSGDDDGEILPLEIVYDLKVGWNLIGIPVVQTTARSTPFPDNLDFYEWRNGAYQQTEQLEAGRGYWVHSREAVTLIVTGFRAGTAGLVLEPGWNLVGPVIECNKDTLLTKAPLSVWAWDAGIQMYCAPQSLTHEDDPQPLKPGLAYWVYLNETDVQDCSLVSEPTQTDETVIRR